MESRICKVTGFGQEIKLEIIDEYGDNFEVRYIHPSTGQSQQEIEQIKYGWTFQNKEDQKNYEKLINAIKEMGADKMTFDWCQDSDILIIEDTPYGF